MCSDAEHIGHSAWKSVTSAADRSGSGSCVIAGPDRRLLGSPRGSWTAVIPAGTPGSSRRGGQSGGVVHASNAIHGDWIPASVREWWCVPVFLRHASMPYNRQVLFQMVSARTAGFSLRTSANFNNTVRSKAGSLRRVWFFSGAGVR